MVAFWWVSLFCQLRGDVLMMGVNVVAEEEGAGVGREGGETVLV